MGSFSFLGAVCFRYSTSVSALCLSHCKGTTFFDILRLQGNRIRRGCCSFMSFFRVGLQLRDGLSERTANCPSLFYEIKIYAYYNGLRLLNLVKNNPARQSVTIRLTGRAWLTGIEKSVVPSGLSPVGFIKNRIK